MIYNQVYNDYIAAMKQHKEADKAILKEVYNSFKNKMINSLLSELADNDCYQIINKEIKILDEEIELNTKVNRVEKVNELTYQKNLISNYLPKQLSEDEIKNIIINLPDKTIPFIMKYFKTNYNGSVDMGLVNRIAKTL